jgi:predicted nucleic acid-binding protein
MPLAVLDTNVVLDWLLFRNPECDALRAALAAGTVRWIATAAMRDELDHVLRRGHLDAWRPDPATLWAAWDRHCSVVAAPLRSAAPGRPRCSDPDDQKFVDLAVAAPARWLVSRDRAVLKLARRLARAGIEVTVPGRWSAVGDVQG